MGNPWEDYQEQSAKPPWEQYSPPVMGNLEKYLPEGFSKYIPDISKVFNQDDVQQEPDYSTLLSQPVVNGIVKSVATVPLTFATMGGTFPAAGIKGYATYMNEVAQGKSVDEALGKASQDIAEFTSRIPQALLTTPEEQKALEILGMPFEYLEKAVTTSGEGWEQITNIPYTAPVVATLLNAYFLGKIPEMAKDALKTPLRLTEIREGAARFQKWVDSGADPVLQPKPISEIGTQNVVPVVPLNKSQAEVKAVGAEYVGKQNLDRTTEISQLADSLKELNSPELPLSERIQNAINLPDTYARAKDALSQGIDKLQLAGQTLFNDIKSGEIGKPKEITGFEESRDRYIGAYQISNFEAKKFGAEIRKNIPDPLRREAIVNWIQADGDIDLLQKQFDQSTQNTNTTKYAAGYKTAMNLTGDEKLFAENVRNYFDSKLQQGIDAGLLEQGLTDYVNQIWDKDNAVTNKFKTDIAYGRLQPNPMFIRKRLMEDYFMGEQLGLNPRAKDIGYLITAYDQSINKAIAAREFIKSLSDTDAKDGRPNVGTSGAGKQIEGAVDEKSPYLIRPRIKGEEFDDYKVIDHPSLRKWKWVGSDESGNPILMQGDLLVHPEVFENLNNMLKTSALRQNPIGRSALNVIATLKGTLLSLSGFHQTQVGLHAIFHGVNPFNTLDIDFSNPFHRAMAEHGLIVSDYKNMELFHEGITSGGLIGKIPGIGTLTQKYTDWLFTDYIPRLKMKMAEEAYRRNTDRYTGKMTDEQIMGITADQSNAAFGELNYAKLGRNPTTQDAMRLILLAPDFFEARARFVGQAMRPYAGTTNLMKSITPNEQAMAAVIRGGLGLYVGARIVNALLNDGDTHTDKPFSVIINDHEFQLRSIPGDVFHLIDDPNSFVFHRLNPTITAPLIKALIKRDDMGRYMNMEDWMKDYFLSQTPIPLQGMAKDTKNIWESALASIGVSAFQYKTNYERELMKEASHFNVTTLSSDDRSRSKIVSKYAQDIQTGIKDGNNDKLNEITSKMESDLKNGKLYMEDIDKIYNYATSDRVGRYMKELPVERILPLWDKANTDEKMKYMPLLIDRITSLMNDHPEKFLKLQPKIEKIFKGE
jgi:hypothetical protein